MRAWALGLHGIGSLARSGYLFFRMHFWGRWTLRWAVVSVDLTQSYSFLISNPIVFHPPTAALTGCCAPPAPRLQVAAARGGRGGRPALAIVVTTGFNTAKVRALGFRNLT